MGQADRATILLTGASGQVGGELRGVLTRFGEVEAPGRDKVDLADVRGDFRELRHVIRDLRPRWIVNPAAYTAVDKAESEPELAYAVNRDAVRAIGEEAQRIGAAVIHFSTDYVFDGTGSFAYSENDATGPVSEYGRSKLAGEVALAETGAAHLIFRTSWVYGARGKNFLLTILKLAGEREVLRIVADQHGAPTWSGDLAAMTGAVMGRCQASEEPWKAILKRVSGVYHATGAGDTTWYGFASEALRLQSEREPTAKFAKIEPIATAEYPTPASRPFNSRMNCAKLQEVFGWKMMDWRRALQEVLSQLNRVERSANLPLG